MEGILHEDYFNPTKKQLIPYALLVQKQPGSLGSSFASNLILPSNLKIVWRYGENLETVFNKWQINDKLNVDRYWAVLL